MFAHVIKQQNKYVKTKWLLCNYFKKKEKEKKRRRIMPNNKIQVWHALNIKFPTKLHNNPFLFSRDVCLCEKKIIKKYSFRFRQRF